jgi:nicotinamidase-related amidase
MEKALIIIDIQTCYIRQNKNQEMVNQLIETVNDVLTKAREQGMPILFVEHEFQGRLTRWFMKKFMNGAGLRESQDFPTDPRVNKQDEETLIKCTGDSFQNEDILNWVTEKGVKEVILVGQDGMHCIKSSINGALKKGLKVSLVDGADIAQNQKAWAKLREKLLSSGEVASYGDLSSPI